MADANGRPSEWIPADLIRKYSGLEILQMVLRREIPESEMSRTLSFRLEAAEKGRVTVLSQPGKQVYNSFGIAHGGYALTLLDTSMGTAIYSALPAGIYHTTIETKVNFVRPIREETGVLRAFGEALHIGKQTGTAEGRLIDSGGTLYAHGTTTCFLFPAEQVR